MSYILDALKKSEEQDGVTGILTPARGIRSLSAPVPRYIWSVIIGLGLILALGSLGLWWYMGTRDATVDARSADDAVGTMATQPSTLERAEPKVNELPESKKTPAAEPKKTDFVVTTLPAKPPVGGLVEQTRLGSPKAKRQQATRTSKKAKEARKKVARAQVPSRKAAARNINEQKTAGDQLQADAAIPYLRQMPDTFRRNLPDMVVNVHLYSADESENVVYINNRQYRKGERIEGRIRLERIVPEGVILNYNGTRFKLPRPN